MLIERSVGIELELCGNPDLVARQLAKDGLCNDSKHDYHCSCDTCHFTQGLLWRYQRDSTVDGEFITRVMYDWASVTAASRSMAAAVRRVNAATSASTRRVFANERTGLHVHVGYDPYDNSATNYVLVNYLLFERWMQRLGSGPFVDKREGMNITFLGALRERGFCTGDDVSISGYCGDRAADLRQQIESDRHIDLNLSGRNRTIEFRVFNATLEAQQIELDVRLAVAFCAAAYPLSTYWPETVRMPASPIKTLEPPIGLDDFIQTLAVHDPKLVALCERQLNRRLEKLPDPAVLPPERYTPFTWEVDMPRASTEDVDHEVDYDDAISEGDYVSDRFGLSLADCTCQSCNSVRLARLISQPSPLRASMTFSPSGYDLRRRDDSEVF